MISYADALALLTADVTRLQAEDVGLDMARRRILAAGVMSPISLPCFDNAAMDGYALRATDGRVAAGSSYAVAAMHAAGDRVDAYPDAEACEIATGARIPAGFDTVIPVERSERTGGRVRFTHDEPQGQNIRTAGGDIEAGTTALPAGRRVDAAAVMLLAALGIETLSVVRQPRVAVIATGSELNAAGPLPPGGIHDSNGPFLATSLSQWGTHLLGRTRVPDTGQAFHAAVEAARTNGVDLIVTTGAVSAGRFDFVPSALVSLGARILFHKVAIRPGKPLLAARFDGGPLVIALPGNPIAVAVGYRFFVAPVLRALAGLAPEKPTRVRLDEARTGRADLLHFGLGRLVPDRDGRQVARVMPSQAAYRILPYTQANTWLTMDDASATSAEAWPLDAADAG